MDTTAWNEQDHGLHHSADDDIHQFLDMNSMSGFPEGLQFDFGFQPQNGAASHLLQRETLDTPMSGTDAAVIMATTMHDQIPALTSAPLHTSIPSSLLPSQPAPGDAISEIDAQIQFLQAQKIQQQQRQLEQQQQQHEQQRRQLEQQQAAFFAQQQRRIVPATPQSLEMRAGDRPYTFQPDHTPQHQVDIYEHFHMKEQIDMSFTPLVSPAVTPLENQFPIDQAFAVPSAYFSPLTSPALHAQSDPMSMLDRTTMGTSTSSPEDMDLEAIPPPQSQAQPQSVVDLTKKLRKGSASKGRGKASVGKSPITKPLRKKTGSTPFMNAQALSDLAETAEPQPRPSKASRLPEPSSNASNSSVAGITDSENSSVSPETLSDMPPPPLPLSRSAKPSPAIQPQSMATPTMGPHLIARTGKHSPATPASLMKLPSPNNANRPDAIADSDAMAAENIEKFELPESVSSSTFQKPVLTPLLTQSPNLRSPALESIASRSSAFQPLPSPVFAKPGKAASVSGSPQIVANSSATNTPNLRKTPQLAPRTSKKRASISSSHVSPALRPKISPNIKPLLPGGVTAEDTASRLLASKSNYQNILEGNLVPGVSYPSELSTNLTSKRTSHKIAEQGRRNRINSALQEIATLLPGGALLEVKDSEAESGDKKDSKNGGTPNSKASTVEMAIEYIKQLKQEVAEANKRAEEAEKKLQDKEGVSAS